MDKLLIGLVIGLAAGVAGGILASSGSSASNTEEATGDASAQLHKRGGSLQETVDQLEYSLSDAQKKLEAQQLRTEQAERRAATLQADSRAAIDALARERADRERAGMSKTERDSAPAPSLPVGEAGLKTMTDEEIAVIRARGKDLAAQVKAAVQSKDKKAVLAAMEELRKLGAVAYPEFFEAWQEIHNTGKPWSPWRQNDNGMGMNHAEFSSLLSREMRELALTNPNNDIPIEAREAAIWGLPFDSERTTADKAKLLDSILRASADRRLSEAVLDNMPRIGDASIPYLTEMARDLTLPSAVRAQALEELTDEFPDNTDWNVVSRMASDPDPDVAKIARNAMLLQTPPATGYLVKVAESGRAAATAGMQSGDVILKYNGQRIEGRRSLGHAQSNVPEGAAAVEVVIYRNGQEVTLQVKPEAEGRLGIDGTFVKKKETQ